VVGGVIVARSSGWGIAGAIPLTGGGFFARPAILVLGTLATLLIAAQVGVIAGSLATSLDHVYSMVSIVLLPLGFLGGVFYSVHELPPAWVVRVDLSCSGVLPYE
jgi:ABC-2 type transport system permease protein